MKIIRNTHIVCTMGPAVDSIATVRSLIRRGMNLARFNFSHGSHPEHAARIALVREASAAEGLPVALILDTKGPEIRTGVVKDNWEVLLTDGQQVDVVAEADATGPQGAFSHAGCITVSYAALVDDIKIGARILIADGLLELVVDSIAGRTMKCTVETGGSLGSRKNVNVLGVHTRLPALSDKDKEDLLFGHEQGMDYVSASFIRKPSDVIAIQKYLASIGSDMLVISKIEDEEGLSNIEEIIRVSAGIMVARGDLGVQIPPEQVPLAQKNIIKLCNAEGKPVITATQMLDSMIHNPRPTRAEAGDVANAILDGADCIMLSGETANGEYPELAVEMMDRIARSAESSEPYREILEQHRRHLAPEHELNHVIAEAATITADSINASCIITPTLTGHTAELISKYRPRHPIVAATCNEKVRRRMLLYWGIVPVAVSKENDSEAMIQGSIAAAVKEGFAVTGDKVVVAAGLPVGSTLATNSIRVHVIGHILGRGRRGFGARCTGRIVKINSAEDFLQKKQGEIILTHTLDEAFRPVVSQIKGIILEGTSELSRHALLTLNPDLVFVGIIPGAMQLFEDSITVTLDGAERIIYEGII
ncbi:pyruvate kinase [Spirochaetia bacterium]|nr:pyruvate kinase [Spirochaetia bacterium]GHU31334.1 pyruvate kinase [Spirochaetia bacterium]